MADRRRSDAAFAPQSRCLHSTAFICGASVVVAPLHGVARLPLGVQVVAAPWREDMALRVAAELESLGIASAPVAASLESVIGVEETSRNG